MRPESNIVSHYEWSILWQINEYSFITLVSFLQIERITDSVSTAPRSVRPIIILSTRLSSVPFLDT